MKLPVFVIVALFFVIQSGESKPWSPENIIGSVTNTTSEITSHMTNYVREKGRSVKKFYVENVRNKIASYFGYNNESKSDTEKLSENLQRKFTGYVDHAQTTGQKVFDVIELKRIKYNYSCSNDDPAIHMTTPQLLALNGYHAESHTVVTDDGYILTIHRIPYSKLLPGKKVPQKTVLLHHGLLGSSADWVLAGPGKSLAYVLSDAGYDVWMANVRGNTYSRAHTSRNVDDFAFWNFTFHDVSQHDLPAVIDYIMEVKGLDVKINYVGHSMGTTVLFALLSTKTQYNKVLRAGFALAPVAYMSNVESPIRILAKFSDNIEFLLKIFGANEFLPQNFLLRWLSKHACEINHYEEAICENSLFVLCGHDAQQFNRSLLPILLGHVPAGASTKTLIHYAQEIHNNGRFQQFDFGKEGNLRQYGTISPPEYPIHKITLPIALISAKNDWLASEIDVSKLFLQLTNPIEHYVVPLKEFNHIDFLWAIDAPRLVYSKLLSLLDTNVGKLRIGNEITSSNYL